MFFYGALLHFNAQYVICSSFLSFFFCRLQSRDTHTCTHMCAYGHIISIIWWWWCLQLVTGTFAAWLVPLATFKHTQCGAPPVQHCLIGLSPTCHCSSHHIRYVYRTYKYDWYAEMGVVTAEERTETGFFRDQTRRENMWSLKHLSWLPMR